MPQITIPIVNPDSPYNDDLDGLAHIFVFNTDIHTYFKSVKSYYNLRTSPSTFLPDTVYIFTQYNMPIEHRIYGKVVFINCNNESLYHPLHSFEDLGKGFLTHNKTCKNSLIVMKGKGMEKRIGLYVPERNILYIYDIGQDSENAYKFAKCVWPQIRDNLKLKKRKFEYDIIKSNIEVSIGCDVEFEILDKEGKPSMALFYFGVGGKIGSDDGGNILEIRPSPSIFPENVVRDLSKLITEAGKKVNLTPLSSKKPLGGHIHVGAFDLEGQLILRHNMSSLIFLLDVFMGGASVRLSSYIRKKLEYAIRGNGKAKWWGFEYRTPPAIFFYHPITAYKTFMLAKKITEWAIRKGKVKIVVDEANNIIKIPKELQKLYNEWKESLEYIKHVKDKQFLKNWNLDHLTSPNFPCIIQVVQSRL